MKKSILFLLIFLLFLASGVTAGGIKDFCKNKWGTNYRMVNHCLEQQQEALRQVVDYAEKHGLTKNNRFDVQSNSDDPYEQILYRCMDKWEEEQFDTYNYRMVDHCIEKQVESYNRIK